MGRWKRRESVEDDPISGRPTTATLVNITLVHHMVIVDRQLTINHIANAISISIERVENVLNNEVDTMNVSA